jgi:hypothetical protein
MVILSLFRFKKSNTQDDPLDEYISSILSRNLSDAICYKESGPLISPDLVMYRPSQSIIFEKDI